jgi:predicted HD phosphohydrolase
MGPVVVFLLHDIGDELSEHGRELEGMTRITRRHDETFKLPVMRDPESSFKGIAVKADAI